MSDLAAVAVTRLGERMFGAEWAGPMARLTGLSARTLLRVKAAAQEGREYPAARGALAGLLSATTALHEAVRDEAGRLGIRPQAPRR